MMSHIKRERLILERLGFHSFPRSGAGLSTEDGANNIFHVQLKVTSQDAYKLSSSALQKLEAHATLHGEYPLFIIFFTQAKVYIVLFPKHIPSNEKVEVKIVNKCTKLSPQLLEMAGGKMLLCFLSHTASNLWCATLVEDEQILNFLHNELPTLLLSPQAERQPLSKQNKGGRMLKLRGR